MRLVLVMMLMMNLVVAKKIALVIGNSDYNIGHLPNPTKDAELIARNLRAVGFTVTIKKNLSTAYKMEKAIDDFAKIVKDDDIAVIYYAGHGVQCKGKNYLIPTKATINRGTQLPSKSLDLDVVIGAVSDIKLAIIMLDACRNNTYPSCSRSQTRGLVRPKINSAGGMIISFATAENTEASDGDKHSPYSLALSKFMNQSLPIETYFREVGGEVLRSSGQRPMLKNSFYGRFSFGGSGGDGKPPKYKWITPKNSVCRSNGGEIDEDGVCESNWENAKKICSASGGHLPTIDVLKQVVVDCGGRTVEADSLNALDKYSKNSKNTSYQSCYKEKGFSSNFASNKQRIYFKIGGIDMIMKGVKYSVKCIH